MKTLEHFSVQATAETGDVKTNCVHVEASCPVEAAELALGETLSTHGNPNSVRATLETDRRLLPDQHKALQSLAQLDHVTCGVVLRVCFAVNFGSKGASF